MTALGESERRRNSDIAALPPDIGKATDDINEQIRREMGQPGPPEAARRSQPASEAALPAPAKPAPKPEAGAIASLAARPLSPGATLASAASTASASPVSVPGADAERILRLGEPPRAEPGRADDFSRLKARRHSAWSRLGRLRERCHRSRSVIAILEEHRQLGVRHFR